MERLDTRVLEFWFGQFPATSESVAGRSRYWFTGGGNFDKEVHALFATEVEQAIADQSALEVQVARQALALVILMDQFPRNIFRRNAKAFDGDARSLQAARQVIAAGNDTALGALECGFLFMPFQHAESRVDQDEGVDRFEALVQRATAWEKPFLESFHNYAGMHRDVVRQFGRFPHRNFILGRENTPAEQAYLDGDGHRFGQ